MIANSGAGATTVQKLKVFFLVKIAQSGGEIGKLN
jgi:hypothetical protein